MQVTTTGSISGTQLFNQLSKYAIQAVQVSVAFDGAIQVWTHLRSASVWAHGGNRVRKKDLFYVQMQDLGANNDRMEVRVRLGEFIVAIAVGNNEC